MPVGVDVGVVKCGLKQMPIRIPSLLQQKSSNLNELHIIIGFWERCRCCVLLSYGDNDKIQMSMT